MPGFILMAFEGVLSDGSDKGPFFSHPDNDGLLMYHGLAQNFTVVLSSVWTDESQVKHWLFNNGVTLKQGEGVTVVFVKDRPGTTVQVRERHLLALRSQGGQVAFIIDSNPEVGAMALKYGVRPLICPKPLYDQWSLRPDAEQNIVSWDEVEAESELQKSLRGRDLPARDARVDVTPWERRGW